MGLDMYLSKKRFISQDERTTLQISGLDPAVNPGRVEYIQEEAGYWRKANAIHRWFVQRVQDGHDTCATYSVSREALAELLELVEQVLEDHAKAPALLPTASGSCFGSTEYGEGYVLDLYETRAIVTEALRGDPDAEFCYQSSW